MEKDLIEVIMRCCNPQFDVNLLAFLGAILVVLGDFLALLVAYQQYCDSLSNRIENGSQALSDGQTERVRLRREFT